MNVILFDKNPKLFYPLSLTRPISEFKIGILTIKQKWSQYYDNVSCSCEQYLNNIYPKLIAKNNLWIDSTIIPNNNLLGCQFHPELSGEQGLEFIDTFIKWND